MFKGTRARKVKKCEISVQQQDEIRQRVKRALQRWQRACDAWLSVKSEDYNRKDYAAISHAEALKKHIDQAADELRQALQMANAA